MRSQGSQVASDCSDIVFAGRARHTFAGCARRTFAGRVRHTFAGCARHTFAGRARHTFAGCARHTFAGCARHTFAGCAHRFPQWFPCTFPGSVRAVWARSDIAVTVQGGLPPLSAGRGGREPTLFRGGHPPFRGARREEEGGEGLQRSAAAAANHNKHNQLFCVYVVIMMWQ